MNNDAIYRPGPQVGAYALIGRNEEILFVTDDSGTHVLPGGSVRNGEPVEQALRHTLRDQIGATITSLDFCSVIEHEVDGSERGSASELAFLFDVTLTDVDHITDHRPYLHWWAGQSDVASLRPAAIGDAIAAGNLSADAPWWAWTP